MFDVEFEGHFDGRALFLLSAITASQVIPDVVKYDAVETVRPLFDRVVCVPASFALFSPHTYPLNLRTDKDRDFYQCLSKRRSDS
ncbi:hypothetical protein FA15DRAFT_668664 [Coprinopsis marcescibilis]|uniref:Uncharacterized protein n=1 Tax=Coprinopsis marcescibilis TaxID=230819 RepID=A0A5C3KXL1_COPMA|nr:hypothetical protein FA15DRAFT_668664 [Coprinopsis marcescibilis]